MPKTPIYQDSAIKFQLPGAQLAELNSHLGDKRRETGRPQSRARWIRAAITEKLEREVKDGQG